MKTKHTIIIILTAITLFSACKDKSNTFQYIDLHPSIMVRDAKQMITTPRYVKLETTNECLIDEAEDIVYYKDCFYILDVIDMANKNRILVFDKNGKFKLGKYGRGPQEIFAPWSFCIQDSLVYIPDNKKIQVISTNNCYIKTLKTDTSTYGIIKRYKDGFIILHGYMKEKYASIIKDNGENRILLAPDIKYNIAPTNTDDIILEDGSFSFFSGFSDIIYTLNDADELSPKYKFRYNNMKGLWDIMPDKEPSPPEMMKYMNSPNFYNTYKYFETDKLIVLTGWYKKNKLVNLVYKDNFKYPIAFGALINTDTRIDFIPDFMIDDSQFCKVLNVFELKDKKKFNTAKDKDLHKLIQSSSTDDNPIIAIYEFKERD